MAKRKWGPGNPLYDWKMRHGKTHTRTRGKNRVSRSGGKMAKKKKSGGGTSGLGGLGKPMFHLSGIVAAGVSGMGVAALAKRFLGAPLGQYTGAALGFAVGGLGGAAGGYLHDNLGNQGTSSGGPALNG